MRDLGVDVWNRLLDFLGPQFQGDFTFFEMQKTEHEIHHLLHND